MTPLFIDTINRSSAAKASQSEVVGIIPPYDTCQWFIQWCTFVHCHYPDRRVDLDLAVYPWHGWRMFHMTDSMRHWLVIHLSHFTLCMHCALYRLHSPVYCVWKCFVVVWSQRKHEDTMTRWHDDTKTIEDDDQRWKSTGRVFVILMKLHLFRKGALCVFNLLCCIWSSLRWLIPRAWPDPPKQYGSNQRSWTHRDS